jgi:tetratricopeptide (TPR) repeat protein
MLLLVIIYLLVHLAASLIMTPLLWGADSWSIYPFYISVILIVLGFLTLTAKFRDPFLNLLDKAGKKLKDYHFWLLVLVLGLALYIFSQTTYFLGDGFLRISDTEKGVIFSGAEPLDTYIHNISHYIVNLLLFDDMANSFSGEVIYRFISILSGIWLLFIIRKYSRSLFPEDSFSASWIMGMVIFSAGFSQLFFGYVESYTILAVTLTLFLFSSINMLKNSEFILAPSVYLSLSFLLHPLSIILFPALIYSYSYVIKDRKILNYLKVLLIPVIFISAMLLIFNWGGFKVSEFFKAYGEKSRFLPVLTNNENIGILSFEHLSDIFNQIILVFPALIGIPVVIMNRKALGNIFSFLVFSVILLLIPAFIIKSELGFARDWDLFSLFAIPATVLVAYAVIIMKENRAKMSFIIIGISLLHTIPWILLNADEELSVNRAEQLATTEHWSGYAKSLIYNDLSKYYYKKKNFEKAFELIERSYDNEKNPRFLWTLASLAEKTGKLDKAIKYFNILSTIDDRRIDALTKLVNINMGIENYTEAEKVLLKILESEVNNAKMYFMLGVTYVKLKDYEKALLAFRNTQNLDSTANLAIAGLAENANDVKNYDEAGSYYRILLESEPENPILNFNLATVYFYQKKYDLSEKYIKIAENLGFDSSLVRSLRNDIKNDTTKQAR